ncbi:hypothetical protein ABPG77_000422 [Micractinium sp. CCAP 211/92]
MPLLHRRPYVPTAPPADLDPEEQVFHIEATGEVFRSYETFLQKKDLYGQTVWACRYSGKGGMTFEEAQEAEKKAVAALASFPADMEEQVCRGVHHSIARVEELVSSIYDSLRPAAAAEGAVGGGGAAEADAQAEQPSPFGSKENKPQQGPGGTAAKPDDAEHVADADSGGAAAGGTASAEPATAKKADGGAAGGGEQRSGRKAKTPKAPVSRSLLRTYIIENAEQQGPEHATKLAWVVRQQLRQRFGLPDELPAELEEQLEASIKPPKKPKRQLDAPKGLGTKLPAKKEGAGKKAAAEGGDAATPAAGKKEKEEVPMVRVEAKSLEEVEAQYKEGTVKAAMVAVLKAVQPQALTVQGIIDKGKEMGLAALEDKHKRVGHFLSSDPNFLRLSKGAYSLHCFHPDKEQLVRAPQPKEPKKAAEGGDAATPAAGKKEKEEVPMVRVEAKSLEEVEKQYKEGTLKHDLVAVLKAVQPEALTVQGIVEKGKEMGLAVLEEKQKGIAHALSSDPNFLRLSKGAYSLHCFHPGKEQLVRAPQPKESLKAAAEGGDAATPAAAKKEKEEVPMVRVEAKSLQEVEAQYKEGTVKAAMVAVLKAVQPQALTVQGIIDKGKEMGLDALEDKQKTVGQALSADPNFLRLSKGAYSLHCFFPDKEQLVRAPQPKEPKKAAEGETPAGGNKEMEKEKEEVPMVRVEAKSLQEVEQQYKEGSIKLMLVAVLKAVQPEALTTQGILDKAKELGLDALIEKKQAISQVMAADPNFLRLSKGAYSLHCFHPDKEQLVRAPQPKKRKLDDLEGEEGEQGSKVAKVDGTGAGEEAEQQVKVTKRLLARHRADLEKAQATCDAAKAAWEADKKKAKRTTSLKERVSDVHIPAEKLEEFEVPEEEREFKGAPDDRKGMLEFRQKLQARMKELAKAKKAFLDAERAKRAKEFLEGNKEAKALEQAYRKAERALEQERRATESAERAAAAAEKKLEKEKERAVKEEERAKERAERELQKVAEREERERRRAEAAKAKEEAKRYPMEDVELLAELRQKAAETGEEPPAEDVAPPNWLSAEESQRLSTGLYVADLVSQFSKQLGCKVLHYDQLEAALADATSGGTNTEADINAGTLHTLFQQLIRFILEDLRAEDEASAQEKRWAVLLSAGTWPEVLRRLVLTRAAEAESEGLPSLRPDQQALMGASMLAFDCVDSLTHDQLLALLRYLADLALDSERMRGILQRRADEAEDAKRDVREELAEQRKALKELLDSEKEERKRKREERRKAEEEEKAAAEAAAAAAAAEGEATAQQTQRQDGQQPMDVDGQVRQSEPSFELPERLREYTGPPGDKKALVQWRQEQQAEKRRLEKERNRWMADQLRRQRELEAQEKAAREAEKAKQREKEEKEEAIMRAQEALEERLERYATRRAPLGADRQHRRYWWGLAGHRASVWVEDLQGRWGSVSTLAELDALVASLDRRGVRELALAEAIEKRFQSIAVAMQRAERAAAAGGDKGGRGGRADDARAEPPRRSGRQTQQVDFFDPAAQAKAGKAASGLASLMGPAEVVAVEEAAEQMQELQKDAGSLVPPPEAAGSWKEWGAALKAAASGSPEGTGRPSAAAVRGALQSSLLRLEEALLSQSVGGLEADGEPSVSEGAGSEEVGERRAGGEGEGSPAARSREQSVEVLDVVDEQFSPTKRPSVTFLWKTQRERTAWQTDLKQAATAARIAYCAAVLAQQAGPMLATLSKNAFSGGKKGGGKGARAGDRGSGKGSSAAAASSRPVSRTSSAAALEAAGSGAGGGKAGKRKAAPPPAENMRVTRSRH